MTKTADKGNKSTGGLLARLVQAFRPPRPTPPPKPLPKPTPKPTHSRRVPKVAPAFHEERPERTNTRGRRELSYSDMALRYKRIYNRWTNTKTSLEKARAYERKLHDMIRDMRIILRRIYGAGVYPMAIDAEIKKFIDMKVDRFSRWIPVA